MPEPGSWSLVICGGGSGGHLFPALAVLEALRHLQQCPARIVFLTAERAIDRQILEHYQVEQVTLSAVESQQFRRRPIRSFCALGRSIRQARHVLKLLPRPVLIGTGGFSSVPGILAGRWRRCPIMLLEQNVIPGRATSFLSRFASVVCLSFTETQQFLPESLRTVVTGNPVRRGIAEMPASSVVSKKRLLVLGGSQGASFLNEAMLRFAGLHREQLKGWTILHQTGEADAERVQQTYKTMRQKAEVAPFFTDIQEMYQRASFVVTRAGGTSLAEIACAGLPAIIVPYPRSLRNHQQINARHFTGRQAALMIEQQSTHLFDLEFAAAIKLLLTDKAQRKTMAAAMKNTAQPDAAQRVCQTLFDLLEQVALARARGEMFSPDRVLSPARQRLDNAE